MSPLVEPLVEILLNVLSSALAGVLPGGDGPETLYDDRRNPPQSTGVKPAPSVRKTSVVKALPSQSVSGNEPTAR